MGGDTADRRPIVAICYDFDKTLSPTDMQAQGYIQSLGLDVDAFWRRSGALAKASNMDQNLAYMYTMLEEARRNARPARGISPRREDRPL